MPKTPKWVKLFNKACDHICNNPQDLAVALDLANQAGMEAYSRGIKISWIQLAVTHLIIRTWESERQEPHYKKKGKQGFVYFIQANDSKLIKIGFSKSPSARMTQIQGMSPEGLALLCSIQGTASQENRLHKRFSSANAGTKEWFHPHPELLQLIEEIRCQRLTALDEFLTGL